MSGVFRLRWPVAAAERTLWLALVASVLLHALVLSLHFAFPDASRAFEKRALDIILVNSKSVQRPSEAQALAQARLDGGGDTERERRVRTPLPPSSRQQRGNELEQAEKRIKALEAKRQRLLEQAKSGAPAPQPRSDQVAPPDVSTAPSGFDLASRALSMARLEGEIARDTEEYNKRPRKKFVGARTDEYRFAQYIENWRQKVERVGTLNYPEQARGKLYGTLILSVSIKSDGSVDKVEINRSSGQGVLDDAARRIVAMAAPYAAFPPDIRRDTDILVITRSWRFTRSDSVETLAQ